MVAKILLRGMVLSMQLIQYLIQVYVSILAFLLRCARAVVIIVVWRRKAEAAMEQQA
jgi:hypothetical protein